MVASAKEICGLPLRGSGILSELTAHRPHRGIGIQMLAKSHLGGRRIFAVLHGMVA
jgi:hypothetical protein